MQASIWLFMLICLAGAHGKIPLSKDDKPRRVFENGTERVFDKDQNKAEEAGQDGNIDRISDEVEVSVVNKEITLDVIVRHLICVLIACLVKIFLIWN